MRTLALSVTAVMVAAISAADPLHSVPVCLNGGLEPAVANRARTLAGRMFATVGVALEWPRASSCPAGGIRVEIQSQTWPHQYPGALAYALAYEGATIVLFYDRITSIVERKDVPCLLAHVLVHELAHIMQGVARHSETGILKARWEAQDFLEMTWKPLSFTSEDVALLHRGLESRPSRLLAAR